ncbi:MAG: D-alanine--D-alanine ligase [Acidobacteria bacterium]|nr:D-alanine--D-alanine ligase [Acidobacteriota bacterium]
MRKLRVLVLVHPDLVPPDSPSGLSDEEFHAVKTEYHVVQTLRALGHEVQVLGVQHELSPIRQAVEAWDPHIVFNLLEEFYGISELDQHVVSYLELLRVPHTGCNPRGLTITRDKALSKKIAAYHRIHVPRFATFQRRRRWRSPRDLQFPLIVKSLTEEASLGISQASVVYSDEELRERVAFIHNKVESDAIAEEFIEGRELYVGALGNQRVTVLPPWELLFENLAPGALPIATARVKHDPRYQEERGIFQQEATDLPDGVADRLVRTTRRLYRLLHLTGYARIDYRLRGDGTLFFLEANPNPEIAPEEEFASAAAAAGVPYPQLIQTILNLGLRASRW